MKRAGFLACVLLAACGGSGGGVAPAALRQPVSVGVVRADAPTPFQVQVMNPLAAAVTVEEVPGDAGPFALMPGELPDAIVNGAMLRLDFVFTPPGAGEHEAEFRVRFRANDGQEREVKLVLVAYVETPRVGLRVPSVDFGTLYVQESKTLRAYVENLSHATSVPVTSMGSVPGEFETALVPTVVLAGEYLSIPIKYTASALGAYDFEVEIQHGAGAPLRLRVTARADTWIPEMVFDFGDVPIVHGDTGWLEVDVPPHAISLYIEAVLEEDDEFLILNGFEGPDGRVYANEQGTGPLKWNQSFSRRVFALAIPNNDRPESQLVPGGGRYRIRFFSLKDKVRVRVIVENRLDGIVDGGTVDLNIFLAPGLGMTNPEQDSKLQTLLQQTDQALGQVGLHLGEISYFQLTNPAFDFIWTNLAELMVASSVAPNARINVFIVPVMFPAVGEAAAVPVPKLNGTSLSGCAICWSCNGPSLVAVLSHEICHCLGLFHTTEYGGMNDNIDDTPECPWNTDQYGCGQNLMSWAAGGLITPGQARVMLGHPLVDPSPSGLAALAQANAPAPAFAQLPPGFCATCVK